MDVLMTYDDVVLQLAFQVAELRRANLRLAQENAQLIEGTTKLLAERSTNDNGSSFGSVYVNGQRTDS